MIVLSLGGINQAQAQTITKVSGSYCVNSTATFYFSGSATTYSWSVNSGINGTDYTISSATNLQAFTVKWLRGFTTSVRCNSTYSSSFTVTQNVTPSVSIAEKAALKV